MKGMAPHWGIKNFVPSKKMGQNFLVDNIMSQKIVHSAHIQTHDIVIEIGPGTGALTKYLLEFNKPLVVIELDKRLAGLLRKQFGHHKNLRIINDDVLEVNLDTIVKPYNNPLLISNLPYSISTPMILKFLQSTSIKLFYCMLQKELAQRLLSLPGTPHYGSISVLVQSFATISKILHVPSNCFEPIPKVDSNVILFQKKSQKYDVKWAAFVHKCFAYKRKTLMNNLKQHFSIAKIKEHFHTNKIHNSIRAEQLNVEQIHWLYEDLSSEHN